MPSTSTPIIVVHYQDGHPMRATITELGARFECKTSRGWLSWSPPSGAGRWRSQELCSAVRVMHATTPTQDAEGRWVYGEAPKVEVGS